MRSPFDLSYPWAALLAVGSVTAVVLLVAAGTSQAAFGLYNTAWDGSSALQSEAESVGAESEILRKTGAYTRAEPNGTVAVVLSPDEAYDRTDLADVRRFVERGGTLVVAEDFGAHSNALLAGIGADARFDGRLLRDERYNYRSPAMPVTRNLSNHSLVANVSSLTLNHATPVRPNGATVLANTSAYAYLDTNRDGEVDDNETVAAYPIATSESVGDGRVIVVGDPSIFINAMLDRPGNRAFVRGLFRDRERVLLDYSHAEALPPLAVAVLRFRESVLLQFLFGVVGVGALAVWAERRDWLAGLRRTGETDDPPAVNEDERRADLASYLRERHPDWDDRRVDRLAEAFVQERRRDE